MLNTTLPPIPEKGVLNDIVAELVPPLAKREKSRLLIVACGVKIHFPWDKACERYETAYQVLSKTAADLPVEIVCAPEPFEDPAALCQLLDEELREGLAGIVLFHAAYTAGEIGSHLGRWLLDHKMPLLSWAWPEEGTGGPNEANSLTCQNFLLQMLKQMGVPYAWLHEAITDAAAPVLETFCRVVHAKDTFKHAKLLHAGGSRVTGFYDGEVDELEVMKTLGCRFDRMDLETVFQHAKKKFSDADVRRLKDVLVAHPSRNNFV